MEEFFEKSVSILTVALTTFLDSAIFFWIKMFLAIYVTVLIVDVILLMYLGDVRAQLRKMRMGAATSKTDKKSDKKEWNAICMRLESDDEKQYRAAILEADNFVYREMETQGYSGSTFAERVSQIPIGSFTTLDIMRDVHALSQKIVFDDKLRITKEQARNALDIYEKFLKSIDVL